MSYEEVEVITATLITWLTTTGDPRPTPGPELDDLLALFEGIITPQDIVDAPVVDLTVDDDEELDSWLDDEEDDEEEDDEEEDDEEEDDEEEDDEEDGTLTDVEDEPFWPAPAPVSPYEPAAPVDDEPEVDREDEEELDEDALLEDDEVEDPQAQFEAAKVKHAEECPICAPFAGGGRRIIVHGRRTRDRLHLAPARRSRGLTGTLGPEETLPPIGL